MEARPAQLVAAGAAKCDEAVEEIRRRRRAIGETVGLSQAPAEDVVSQTSKAAHEIGRRPVEFVRSEVGRALVKAEDLAVGENAVAIEDDGAESPALASAHAELYSPPGRA